MSKSRSIHLEGANAIFAPVQVNIIRHHLSYYFAVYQEQRFEDETILAISKQLVKAIASSTPTLVTPFDYPSATSSRAIHLEGANEILAEVGIEISKHPLAQLYSATCLEKHIESTTIVNICQQILVALYFHTPAVALTLK